MQSRQISFVSIILAILTGNQVLAYGSAIGGVLFFLSLIGMSIIFWRN